MTTDLMTPDRARELAEAMSLTPHVVREGIRMLSMEEALALPETSVSRDKPYLPTPNRVDVVITPHLAPAEITKTAFMLPLLRTGALVMAHNTRRGAEFAGGHIDPGENAEEAAMRECLEETGYIVMGARPIGFLRMISTGDVPPGWRYPHPVSFQQFFTGEIVWKSPRFVANDECHDPFEFSAGDVRNAVASDRIDFYHAAVKAMGI